MTTSQSQASSRAQWRRDQPMRHRPTAGRRQRRYCYRLLHSTGDIVFADRATALARLAGLPGGKLFALPAGDA